ncbi:putative quinol monooxygenase [Paenarthrobacter sp. YJN-5]|uniref:putative quinol monooxygenase n=1 Tax=Paenarthrobacter sp. YJN-5 TaxID=2735316 RepID=UPI0018781901|nr:antibiotic biosynthesis monooxygenase [Paenarthrobacter sp. YJN-5]QOT15258.1 antibiotic biosynthesis monooxygenase [Paenarthrobacter sp. YJN-5]
MPRDLYAEYTVLPGHEERVAEMMRELIPLVQAEPGNLMFLAFTLAEQPRKYFVMERYSDDEAFRQHMAAEYGHRFNAEIGEHIEGDMTSLTWLEEFAHQNEAA